MPRRKRATVWRKKALIQDLATGVPFFACMFAGSFHSRIYFGVGLVFFAVGIALLLQRFRIMLCESCGQKLRRNLEDGSEATFHCAKCDIVWTTGVFQDGG